MKKANFPSEHILKSPENTRKLGKTLSRHMEPGLFVSLKGNLGAGKTTLARGIIEGFGYKGPVTSPTFTLINEYPTRPKVYHMDFYRLADEDEGIELGLDDLFSGSGIYLVEWCEKIPSWLPKNFLEIEIILLEQGERLVRINDRSKQ